MQFIQTQKMLWLKDEVQKIKEKILNKLNKDLKVFKSAVENKLSAKDVQLSLRMTRLTETILNMTREINSLESSNIGQNTRLWFIDARLVNVSVKLENLISDQFVWTLKMKKKVIEKINVWEYYISFAFTYRRHSIGWRLYLWSCGSVI